MNSRGRPVGAELADVDTIATTVPSFLTGRSGGRWRQRETADLALSVATLFPDWALAAAGDPGESGLIVGATAGIDLHAAVVAFAGPSRPVRFATWLQSGPAGAERGAGLQPDRQQTDGARLIAEVAAEEGGPWTLRVVANGLVLAEVEISGGAVPQENGGWRRVVADLPPRMSADVLLRVEAHASRSAATYWRSLRVERRE